jgi:hypothetical protein
MSNTERIVAVLLLLVIAGGSWLAYKRINLKVCGFVRVWHTGASLPVTLQSGVRYEFKPEGTDVAICFLLEALPLGLLMLFRLN